MKFYIAEEPYTGRQILAGTQEAAKAINKDFQVYEVPTDKDGLMFVMQEALDQIHACNEQINRLKHDLSINPNRIYAEPSKASDVPEKAPESIPAGVAADPNSIVHWLLEIASQAQVEAVFAAIGARWGEARN